jgi:hypothetical protein
MVILRQENTSDTVEIRISDAVGGLILMVLMDHSDFTPAVWAPPGCDSSELPE